MAHCVIILQPLWILIKKNSKWEGEKKHLNAKSGFRLDWCVFFSTRTDLRPKRSSRNTNKYSTNQRLCPFPKCYTARSVYHHDFFFYWLKFTSRSPKRIGSSINWVRRLCWRIQRCECCNKIITFKSRKWVLNLWVTCSELAHHWSVNLACLVAGNFYHIFSFLFFPLAPFFHPEE